MSGPASTYQATTFSVSHPDGDALRVVLFGMPDAGKSSLLGALAQAAQSQDRGLHGRLLDLTHGLGELWRRVYENRPRETLDEIVPYPVYFERFIPDPDGNQRIPLLLIDCDGRVANDILSQRRALQRDPKAGPLAQAVLDAHVLVLVVDASAVDAQLDRDFREFVRLLKIIQKYRSHDHAVGGLPVHLVLTKCDLLAREVISGHEWEARIERRKQQVVDRFGEFLRTEGIEGFSFGSIDLHINATAVKRPGLTETPAQPREPFGVAELFYECFENAVDFRDRVARADRRLKYTVFGVAGILGALALGAVLLFGFGGPRERTLDLAAKVEAYQQAEGSVQHRLAAKTLEQHKKELIALRDDRGFHDLPPDKQRFIRQRFDEIQAYQNLREALAKVEPVSDARSLDDLAALKKKLETDAAPAPEFAQEWEKSPNPPDAVVERRHKLDQIEKFTAAVGELRRFYTTLDNEGKDLIYDPKLNNPWEKDVLDLFERAKSPPFAKSDPARGPAYDFINVELVRQDWQARQQSLQQLQEFAAALGILNANAKPPLQLTESPAGADINSEAAARLRELRTRYPNYKTWSLANLKDTVRPRFQTKLDESYEAALHDGQQLIARRLKEINPTGPDTPADWQKIADWLKSPAVQEWSELIALLAKYRKPEEEDPVSQTVSFLRKKEFPIEIRSLSLRIPDNLSDNPLRPDGDFKLLIQTNGQILDKSLKLQGSGKREGTNATVYEFRPTGDKPLTFTLAPGDVISPQLTLRERMKPWQLSWVRCRTNTYQMERLLREPRLHEPDKLSSTGEVARGVTLKVDGVFEQVPELIPGGVYDRK
jgi:GTPase SAR1 family protein